MSDNVTVPGTGSVLAFDDIGGVLYARTKVSVGADGAAADLAFGRAAAAASLPVGLSTEDLAALNAVTTAANATTAAVAAPLAAGTNNIGDVDVLTVPKTATTTRTPVWASGLHLAIATATARVGPLTGTEVIIAPDTDCYVNIGDVTVNATIGAGSLFLAAGSGPHYFQMTTGSYVAAIRKTADGVASVIPVA